MIRIAITPAFEAIAAVRVAIPETMKALVFALALLILSACQQPLRSETNDEWFKLVTDLNAQRDRLKPAHQRFVRHMVNILSMSEDAKPTPQEQKWLLIIKRRL